MELRAKEKNGTAGGIEAVRQRWGSAVDSAAKESASIKSVSHVGGAAESTGGDSAPAANVVAPRRRVGRAGSGAEGGDFLMGALLGKGGMGLVFRAEQTGLDRAVALKTIHPDQAARLDSRRKFAAEARVTGELDHPNIVPVYELAVTPDGALFYTMKEVRGRSWAKALPTLGEAENIDILLRVADAVAFAHARGVVHRDLKPENVMLGDYGEVLLMDWGLAVGVRDGVKAERLSSANARGGTPAYMAPEMAAADAAKIGPASDIYLLGAILHEILTGLRPHHADNIFACLYAAMRNVIQPSERDDEWMDIAKRAMATDPARRYRDVREFLRALRDCREHSASLVLSREARSALDRALESDDYSDYAQAVFGFGEALRLWPGNAEADAGLSDARKTYAEAAIERGDFDLALSQTRWLPPDVSLDLPARAHIGKTSRERRRFLVKRLIWLSAGLMAVVLLVGGIAFLQVSRAKSRAVAEAATARKAEAEASMALLESERSRVEAQIAQKKAESALRAQRNAEAREHETKRKADARAQEDRHEHLRLQGQLADAARKLDLWKSTDAVAEFISAVAGAIGEDGENDTPLAVTARELAPWPEKLEDRARVLTVLAMFMTRPREFVELAKAFTELAAAAAGSGQPELAERLAIMAKLIDARARGRGLDGILEDDLRRLEEGRKKREENLVADLHRALLAANPRYTGNGEFKVENGQIVEVDLSAGRKRGAWNGCRVRDLEPLRGLPLRRLDLSLNEPSTLAALEGMPLEGLWIQWHGHIDEDGGQHPFLSLEPLRNAPLKVLRLSYCPVDDLGPLRGKKLDSFIFSPSRVYKQSQLRNVEAKRMQIGMTAFRRKKIIVDLGNINITGLKDLNIAMGAGLKNIAALENSEIVTLGIPGMSERSGNPSTLLRGFAASMNKVETLKKFWFTIEKPMKLDWLIGLKVASLQFHTTFVEGHDLSPLLKCDIKEFSIGTYGRGPVDISVLNNHPTLQTIMNEGVTTPVNRNAR